MTHPTPYLVLYPGSLGILALALVSGMGVFKARLKLAHLTPILPLYPLALASEMAVRMS